MIIFFVPGESTMIPEAHTEAVIDHVCMVHGSVGEYSYLFQQKLRRSNYVTPKNYLDFIITYCNLLEDKDKYILGEVTAQLIFCSKSSTSGKIGKGCAHSLRVCCSPVYAIGRRFG